MSSMASSLNSNDGSSSLMNYTHQVNGAPVDVPFQNLDAPSDIDQLMHKIQDTSTQNFLLDFNDQEAHVAFDLSTDTVGAILDAPQPSALNGRWINIWYPYNQVPLLETIAKHYDFSPRLLAMMCSDPRQFIHKTSDTASQRIRRRGLWHRKTVTRPSEDEVENGCDELSEHSSIYSESSISIANLYRIVDEIWHYSSVDLGRKYMCIGYNSLYGTKQPRINNTVDSVLPNCKRVWTWLLLCSDSTVITINEDPFPFHNGEQFSHFERRIISETRRNLVNVFRSLSQVDNDPLQARNPLTVLPIRTRLGSTPEETVHRNTDAPGLLFYYLFENWQNSYTLVTRKESRYGLELNSLRAEMFKAPKLAHIDRLDHIGKELSVLKRHYASYQRLVERILEPRNSTAASLANSRIVSDASRTSLDTIRPILTEKESMLGVSLSSAARSRFKRLQDLIDLYALSEVEEYIHQKESLISLNFNLLTLKESLDVERLTRITLLLTKATFLFLPVSLMTAYFSVQLQHVEYTVKEFWSSFAVILGLSWIALFVFGVFSQSLQTLTALEEAWGMVQSAAKWMAGMRLWI